MEKNNEKGNFFPRTDLAIEISDLLRLDQAEGYQIPGVEITESFSWFPAGPSFWDSSDPGAHPSAAWAACHWPR